MVSRLLLQLMLTMHFLPQPYKVGAITKETEASRSEETCKGQCGLAIESLSTREEALDLSPTPQKTEEKGERAKERGRGEGEGRKRGEKKLACACKT